MGWEGGEKDIAKYQGSKNEQFREWNKGKGVWENKFWLNNSTRLDADANVPPASWHLAQAIPASTVVNHS
jgi:hypothetical protein